MASRLSLLGLVLALASCNGSDRDELCQGGMSAWQSDLAQATARLDLQSPAVAQEPGSRRPAAVAPLDLELRNEWKDWSVDRLKEIQRALDVVGSRSELSNAAVEIMSFYGFAAAGRPDLMRSALDDVKQSLDRAAAENCPAAAPSSSH
ncbi:MAG TPA: hypothetical protein VL588_01700 [Bdellovibrionota bacterium]|jgi:hypothetical protein|nr:hypothetical protein [Bdellovibrionota bacterium]